MTSREAPGIITICIIGLSFSSSASAQTLGEIAKKTQAARQEAAANCANIKPDANAKQQDPTAKKDGSDRTTKKDDAKTTCSANVYTNDSLKGLPPSPDASPSLSSTETGAAKAALPDSAAKPAADNPENSDATQLQPPKMDEAYWRARWEPLAAKIGDELAKNVELSQRIYDLTVELSGIGPLNARRAGVEAERQRLITEREQNDNLIASDKAALADIQEEGRRAGALPGWFRSK